MSYCRWSDGDCYVYEDSEGGFTCHCGARGSHERAFHTATRQQMLDHLREHKAAGHRVPDYALERLQHDVAEGLED